MKNDYYKAKGIDKPMKTIHYGKFQKEQKK